MTNFKKLCAPHIKKAKKCRKELILKLKKELEANDFFKIIPKVETYYELKNYLYNVAEIRELFLNSALKSEPDAHLCDVPVINYKGEVIKPESSYLAGIDFEFKYSSKEKPIMCGMMVSVIDNGMIISVLEDNILLQMFNRHGFDIPLLKYPNYSNDDFANMLGLDY